MDLIMENLMVILLIMNLKDKTIKNNNNNNNNNSNNNNTATATATATATTTTTTTTNKCIYLQNCYSSLAEMLPLQGGFATPGSFATCTCSFDTPSGIFATAVTAVLLPANDWLKGVSCIQYAAIFQFSFC